MTLTTGACPRLRLAFVLPSSWSHSPPDSDAGKRSDDPGPNVLMLIADDLRPDIGCFGANGAVTPRLDELAKESLVLTRNYVQQAVCGPTCV